MQSSMRAGLSSTWRPIRTWYSPRAGIGSVSCKRASTRATMRPPSRRHRRPSRYCRRGGEILNRLNTFCFHLNRLNTFSLTRSRGRHSMTLHRPRSGPSIWRHSPPTTSKSISGRRIAQRISGTAWRWSAPRSPAAMRRAQMRIFETPATATVGVRSARYGSSINATRTCTRNERLPLPPLRSARPLEQLDLGTVIKASQAVSSEIVLGKLMETLMVIAVEHAGADRGLLILLRDEEPQIEAEATTGCDRVEIMLREAAVTPSELPESVLHYVIRTRESVILDDAASSALFSTDPYVQLRRPRSVLCLPLVKQANLVGVLYLENKLTFGVFTPGRLTVLELLTSQAAISLDNARVYTELAQENSDRRKAEEALRASEERWRKLFENSSAGIVLTAEDGHYLAANLAFQKMLGYTDEELQRITALDVTHEEDRAETAARLAEAGGGQRRMHRIEKRYLRKDGGVIWADVSTLLVPATGSTPPFFSAVIVDITERKLAEEALRESEQRLQDIIDNTTSIIFVKDMELRYLLVNREYERRHHIRREQIRGKTDFDIHPHSIAETVRANDRRVIEAGEPIQFEEAVPSDEGERLCVVAKFLLRDRTGKPYAVCGIATDITERKRAESEIRQLNASLEKRVAERTIELVQSNDQLKRAEEKLRKRSEQVQKHRDVLLGLAHSDKSDLDRALRKICSVSAAALDVARVSPSSTSRCFCTCSLR